MRPKKFYIGFPDYYKLEDISFRIWIRPEYTIYRRVFTLEIIVLGKVFLVQYCWGTRHGTE